MLVDINKVVVGERIRKDLGNLDELAEDIKDFMFKEKVCEYERR